MKVKIRNKIYDSNQEPIMIILSDEDKVNIANMHSDRYKFISYPTGTDINDVRKFIDSSSCNCGGFPECICEHTKLSKPQKPKPPQMRKLKEGKEPPIPKNFEGSN